MRRIASCECALVAYDVYYSWFSLHPRTVALMNRGYGEPFLSGVEPGGEGALGTRVGMELSDVVNAEEANRRYVPRRGAGQLVCPAFAGMAMAVTGTASVRVRPWRLSSMFPHASQPMAVSAGPHPTNGDAVATQPLDALASSAIVAVSLESLVEMIATLVGETISADASLMEAGLDSLLSVEFTTLLQRAVGDAIELPSTIVFDEPSARQIGLFLGVGHDGNVTFEQLPHSDVHAHRSARGVYAAGLSMLVPGSIERMADGFGALACSLNGI